MTSFMFPSQARDTLVRMRNAADGSSDTCLCGKQLVQLEAGSAGRDREVPCSCGRKAVYELVGSRWTLRAILTPERSVPIEGFSRELRLLPDTERFWFLHTIENASLPVHVVLSPSLRIAEVKAADMKVLRLEGIASASEACRIWVERRDATRRSGSSSASKRSSSVEPTPRYNI
jgi:hypothetical protein